MPLPHKLIETNQAHLEQLITEQVQEGPHVDFKRELPAAWDNGAKHDLYADVSAFANAGGGDLIYGMDQDDQGQAATLVPIDLNADETARRLADFLMNGVEPRMPGVQVHPVPVTVGAAAGFAFVIRVPQSWVGPHRVKSNYKFYIREGNRKRELNIPEIRELFVRSDSQAQKVRDFRAERLGRILTGEVPCPLVEGPVWVLHVIPTQAALGQCSIDPIPYLNFVREVPCLGGRAASARINLDGALGLRNPTQEGRTHGYTQFFRNGFVEAIFVITGNPVAPNARRALHGATYENHAAQFMTRVRTELEHAGINQEVSVMMSLLGADRVELGFDRFDWNVDGDQGRFDRTTVVLPDVLVPADATLPKGLKAMFDLLWQAAGMFGSINFNAAGEWEPRR
ncbi:AlbA family DNA-binding domain-containing protein [Burkholderia pseudomallei]|uniref:AlbA family DNA-binding domain-containing protein n=1 Tax=Burkholderia pseudomallei TaxID=28450 RepID=UPI0015C315D3|nr:ATP-binding protein [Burkholderia pseudomallei]